MGNSTETTVYGIGTTDAFFGNPDPTATIFPSSTRLENSSTGIGWLYQRRETTDGTGNFSKLFLVDFGPGGNPRPTAAGGSWNIVQELDLATLPAGWYRLSVTYDAATGDVQAAFADQTFTFTAAPSLLGTFYVGYRTAINNFANNRTAHDPPTFIVQTPPPLLQIFHTATNTVVVSWPSPSTGFSLQANTNIATPTWTSAGAPFDDTTNKFIIVNPPAGNRFYRLLKP